MDWIDLKKLNRLEMQGTKEEINWRMRKEKKEYSKHGNGCN